MRRLAGIALLGASLYVVISWAAFALTAWSVRPQIEAGAAAADAGLAAVEATDPVEAESRFAAAIELFGSSKARLEGWWLTVGGGAPFVRANHHALVVATEEALRLARSAAEAARAGGEASGGLSSGQVNLTALGRLESRSARIAKDASQSLARIAEARSGALLPPVAQRLAGASGRLARAGRRASEASRDLALLQRILGSERERRYFVAFVTPAELRASGGVLGSFAVLNADGGHLRLLRVGRNTELNRGGVGLQLEPSEFARRYGRWQPETHWQNMTMSPDFPSVARAIVELYPQAGGEHVDGVVSLDPAALAALLAVTGPVRVATWPEPLTADNLERVLLVDQYAAFTKEDRVEFLGEVAQATFDAFSRTAVADLQEVIQPLSDAVKSGHLRMFSVDPHEQSLLARSGLSGALGPVQGDDLAVVNQNASASKIESFFRRSTTYRVAVDPSTGSIVSEVEVEMRNEAPASGLPRYVLGPDPELGLPPATNRTFMSVYSPLELESLTVDGMSIAARAEWELGRNVYSTFVDIPPGGTVVARLRLVGRTATDPYRLTVHPQTFAGEPEVARVEITWSKGWKPEGVRGLRADGRGLTGRRALSAPWTLEVGWRKAG